MISVSWSLRIQIWTPVFFWELYLSSVRECNYCTKIDLVFTTFLGMFGFGGNSTWLQSSWWFHLWTQNILHFLPGLPWWHFPPWSPANAIYRDECHDCHHWAQTPVSGLTISILNTIQEGERSADLGQKERQTRSRVRAGSGCWPRPDPAASAVMKLLPGLGPAFPWLGWQQCVKLSSCGCQSQVCQESCPSPPSLSGLGWLGMTHQQLSLYC